MNSPLPNRTAAPLKLLSVVIPARNEEHCIASTVEHLHLELRLHQIPHEIIVIDDSSDEATWEVLSKLKKRIRVLRPYRHSAPNGFGRAVIYGLEQMCGDAVVVMMADESDDSRDVVTYWKVLNEGYDCVFGSRFEPGGGVIDYPKTKLVVNRLANLFIKVLFGVKLNDTTNAFKAYRREVIEGCRPLLSPHFNLTVELPLKAVVRGFSWKTIPITWRNRRHGSSKLRIREMGSRYLFVCLYAWLEKYFSRGDYHKNNSGAKCRHTELLPPRSSGSPNEDYLVTKKPTSIDLEDDQEKACKCRRWRSPDLELNGDVAPIASAPTVDRANHNPMVDEIGKDRDLAGIYGHRFRGSEEYRNRVWKVLLEHFFQPLIAADSRVLDLGCGYGEFINNVRCGARLGMDLNPDTAQLLSPEVHFLRQDCSAHWAVQDGSLDVVFSSNFLEHLADKQALSATLVQAKRCLRSNGKLILMGPNLRFLHGAYWDFWDHCLPLTDKTLQEALEIHGFEVRHHIPRFLPYTMATGRRYPMALVRAYLRLPIAWRFIGKQFLLVAQPGLKLYLNCSPGLPERTFLQCEAVQNC